jgi:nucleoid-associated protein YgaU
MKPPLSTLCRLVVVAVAIAPVVLLGLGAVQAAARGLSSATAAPYGSGLEVFTGLVSAAAWLVLGSSGCWLVAALLISLLAESGPLGQRLAGPAANLLTPRRLRLLLRLACGIAVAAPVGLPAHAGELGPVGCPGSVCRPTADALPIPDRPDVTAAQLVEPVRASAPVTVVVQPGDTLWAIAAAHLPATPPDAAIAAAWPVWFGANTAAIGDNPHLIHPGTRLSVPKQFRQPAEEP